MISWVKSHKLTVLLLLFIAYLLLKQSYGLVNLLSVRSPQYMGEDMMGVPAVGGGSLSQLSKSSYPPTTQENRLVVQESSMSLKVKNVRQTVDSLIDHAQQVGGYMVSSSLTSPEEAPFAIVALRLPATELKESLAYFRSLSVKVVSENLLGRDVTDEYVDIEARLATLSKTKARFEGIMDQATAVQDILQVQREILSLQDQIDGLKGRQQYLAKTVELAKITVYLSTDEYALPYAPATPFRPAVILKEAVRSLVGTLRGAAQLSIWLGVYSVVWLPVVLGVWWYRRRRKTSSA